MSAVRHRARTGRTLALASYETPPVFQETELRTKQIRTRGREMKGIVRDAWSMAAEVLDGGLPDLPPQYAVCTFVGGRGGGYVQPWRNIQGGAHTCSVYSS